MKPFVKLIFENIFKDMVVKVKVKQQPTKMSEEDFIKYNAIANELKNEKRVR